MTTRFGPCAITDGPSYPDPEDCCHNCQAKGPDVKSRDYYGLALCSDCDVIEYTYHIHRVLFEGFTNDDYFAQAPMLDALEETVKSGDYDVASALLLDIQQLIFPCLTKAKQEEVKKWYAKLKG